MDGMKIIVQDIPPSNNEYMGNSHNFNKYRNEKQKWHWMIKAAIKKKPAKPYVKATVELLYFFKTRVRHDPDNYSGKFILDALVSEGILKDDSFNNITLILKADYDKENPRTDITIIKKMVR